MKRILLLFLLYIAGISVFAQKQGNFWYFGNYAGLSFSLGVPVALTDGALSTGEGCSSISTASGNLEFYTDGRFVYNREHEQMPHGSGLLGHSSSTESGIIVPRPGYSTQYYIFTVDARDNNLTAGLCYSRVDMTLEGGLGDVVTSEKNVSLLPYSCEKVTAVGHSNGVNFWVITHQWGSNAFYAYEVSSTGVNTTPVISNTGPVISGDLEASKGYIKVSPDGTKVALANNTAFNVIICNFSTSSGIITHIVTDNGYVNPGGSDPGGPYGVEFSPNSHLLYIAEWKANRRISQYDVTTSDPTAILNSKVVVATVGQTADPIGAMQIAPDNRMYIARNNSGYLSRINSPNTPGVGCGFVDNAVNLAGRQCRYGLPPFIQSFFYLTADYYWDVPTCDETPVKFYTSASDNPDSVRWNFGDPGSGPLNTSTLLNPSHVYPGTGNYWVTLLVYLYGAVKNVFHIIVVSPAVEMQLGNDTTLCAYEPFYIDAGPGYGEYLWQDGSTEQVIQAQETGWYWCQVTGAGGCYDIDSMYVTINPVPDVSAGPDQTIANGTSTLLEGSLTGGSGNFTYSWQPAGLLVNPNVLQPTTVNLGGTTLFTLTVTDNQGGCTDADQVLITVLGGALACTPTADPDEICVGEQSQLMSLSSGGAGPDYYVYDWTSTPPGFTSTESDPVVNPTQTTTYHLSLYDGYSTVNGNVTLTVHPLPLPNAGTDKTINYGTNTVLFGSASGGSGSYIYHWEPADSIQSGQGTPQPTTRNLHVTNLFELTVTDGQTGCVCEAPDGIIVTVVGGPFAVNPQATPDTICSGEAVQLFAFPSGGSGNYTSFSWSSNPAGFSSTLENPVAYPLISTEYRITASDGYNNITGTTFVQVKPSPYTNLGANQTVCVFDTITLDATAGNPVPNCTYLWSNGSTEPVIKVATTGIGFDMKNISVEITSPDGCTFTDQITVAFDFAECNGIEEQGRASGFEIYPNPGNGMLQVDNLFGPRECTLSVVDLYGREIISKQEFSFTESRNSFSLDLSNHPRGIYLIRISEKGKNLLSVKYLLNGN